MSAAKTIQTLLIVILLSIIASDIHSRFLVEKTSLTNPHARQQLDSFEKRQLSSEQMQILASLYSEFYEKIEAPINTENSLIEMVEDDPSKVLLNDHLLELKAVVSIANEEDTNQDDYVLIKDTNIKTNVSEIIRIANKQRFLGFEVELVDRRHIRLIPLNLKDNYDAATQSTNEVTLAMYRRAEPKQAGNKE